MENVKYGIIGPGRIAEKFAQTFQLGLVKGSELIAVASSQKSRADGFAAKFSIPRSYGSYYEILCDNDIDIIYIANLNHQHYDTCQMCIQAGKNILCEKPMSLREQESRLLIESARRSNVFLMEAMWTRFTPAVAKAKQWIEEGRIGKLKSISANLCVMRNPGEFQRLFDPAQDGGALFDMGVYGIQLIQYFSQGKKLREILPVSVPAFSGVDGSTYLYMVYEDDLVGEIKCSISFYTRNDALLCGDKGYICISPFFNFAQQVELYTAPFPSPNSISPARPVEVYTKESPSGFEYEILHAAQCVRDGLKESLIMPLEHSLECSRIFDIAMKAFHSKKKSIV